MAVETMYSYGYYSEALSSLTDDDDDIVCSGFKTGSLWRSWLWQLHHRFFRQ